jgi:hypothetical protein
MPRAVRRSRVGEPVPTPPQWFERSMGGRSAGRQTARMAPLGIGARVGSRLPRVTTGTARLHPRTWLAFTLGGLGLGGLAAIVGDTSVTQPLLTTVGLLSGGAIFLGVRMNRPARPWPWLLMGICLVTAAIGTPLIQMAGIAGLFGQVITAAGATVGIAGFVRLIRGRIPGGDRPAFIDAAIIASGVGVLIWALGFAPYIVAARQS